MNATFYHSYSPSIIILYNNLCPLNYCKSGYKAVKIGDDPSKQCASNRTGILCGTCKVNFSLAIGSSRCIECSNSHNMALLLAFAAAGVCLVLSILALNLTVTQHIIGFIFTLILSGLIKIFLPLETQEHTLQFILRVFVA